MNPEETKLFYLAAEKISSGNEEEVLVGISIMLNNHLSEGADVITHCLTHSSPRVKLAAIKTMGELHASGAVSSLTALLGRETDPHVRATAAIALGSTRQRKALPALTNLLKDEDSRVRANAVEAIALMGDPATVSILTPLLEDENHRVKANVAMALWQFGGLKMLNVLKRMLKTGDDKWKRASAAYALGEIGGFQTMATLISALDDRSAEVRRNVISSLGKMGAVEINKELIPFLSDDDPHIRASTLEALCDLNSERNIDSILHQAKVEKDAIVLDKMRLILADLVQSRVLSVMEKLKELLFSRNPRDQGIKGLLIEVFEAAGTQEELFDLQNIVRSLAGNELKDAARKAIKAIKCRLGTVEVEDEP